MRRKSKPSKSPPILQSLPVSAVTDLRMSVRKLGKRTFAEGPGGGKSDDGLFRKLKRQRLSSTVASSSPSSSPSIEEELQENKEAMRFVPFRRMRSHTGLVSSVKFSPSGHWLASCSHDKSIKIYGALDGQVNRSMVGHEKAVLDIAWSSDSRFLASVSDDMKLKTWSLATGKCLKDFEGHRNGVLCCDWSPDSSLIVSGGLDSTVHFWNARKGVSVLKVPEEGPSWGVTSVNFSPDGSLVLTSNYSEYWYHNEKDICRVLDPRSGCCVRKLRDGIHSRIAYAAFSPNGKYFIASRMDGSIRLYDLGMAKCVKTYYRGHVNRSYMLPAQIYPSGNKWIISGSENHYVYMWDLQTTNIVQKLSGHFDVVTATACHPSARLIASGSKDTTVRLYATRGQLSSL